MRSLRCPKVDLAGYFDAAVHAVAPDLVVPEPRLATDGSAEVGSGRDLWDRIVGSEPGVAAAVAVLTTEQRTLVQRVLDGMLREQAVG